MDQPGKAANPARGQLNRENEHSPVRVTWTAQDQHTVLFCSATEDYEGETTKKTDSTTTRQGVSYYCSVCVCVFFPSILDIKFVGRTSRGHTGGRSHRIFNPPSFCGACLDFCRCTHKKITVINGKNEQRGSFVKHKGRKLHKKPNLAQ